MSQFDYDLLIIGAGSAGVRCARVASELGARVAVIENRHMGGTCVNVGCVPKKLFVYASRYREHFESAGGFGWSVGETNLDWNNLRDAKTEEIQRLNRVYESILEKSGVKVIMGAARIDGPQSVIVNGETLSAPNIVIATGGWPRMGDYPGAELAITSNDVFYLDKLPDRILIEGGGYVAVEFAGIFHGLGCEVELIYRGEKLLRGFDEDIRDFLAQQMREKGIELRFMTEIAAIEADDATGMRLVTFNDGRQGQFDSVLSAIGRNPMTEGLGLEQVGIRTNWGGVINVDDHFRTSVDSIFALGDVVGRMPLTPVALKEATALAQFLFRNDPIRMDYTGIATAVFSQPEVATIGLSEADARACYGEVEVYKTNFKPMKHTLSGLPERALMKLVVKQSDQKVVGCHMVGEHAGEIMQGIAIAINMGATKQDFDNTVGIHPTAAEEFVTLRTLSS